MELVGEYLCIQIQRKKKTYHACSSMRTSFGISVNVLTYNLTYKVFIAIAINAPPKVNINFYQLEGSNIHFGKTLLTENS